MTITTRRTEPFSLGRMIAWWTPRRMQRMFFENAEGKAEQLNGKAFPQPPLVWRVTPGDLKLRAICENKRPDAETALAVAPFWNLSDDGRVCLGSMRCPETASVTSIGAWEQGFYESAFTHANVGRVTRHKGGHDALWAELAGKRRQCDFGLFGRGGLLDVGQCLVGVLDHGVELGNAGAGADRPRVRP